MSKANSNDAQNFWGRDPRFTALPVKDVLKIRMKDLGIKNVDLQKTLGYPAANVISMMKGGTMRLPEGKAIEVADALKVDRIFLLGKVIGENNPELWKAISTVMGDRLVSANEMALVNFVRAALDGHDVNLTESTDFIRSTTPALQVIVERQKALTQAALDRHDD